MSVNSSSSSDSSLHLHFSFKSSLILYMKCITSRPSSIIFTTFTITTILLLLPLCIFILHHGLQQWRQKRSTSSVSHSDCFTYHMVVMELVLVSGCALSCCGVYRDDFNILFVGLILFFFTWFGETFFHVLTCVERYLAVVHPITYLSLRNQRGIRIRNISIACVWLLSGVFMALVVVMTSSIFVALCFLLVSLTIISFCSISVLCVLIRPGPGEQGGGGERVDQSKLRAFYTIMCILGVLLLRFAWGLIWAVLFLSGGSSECAVMVCQYWFSLPSSLVLPLLFLHRKGKFECCEKNIERG